MVAITFTDRAAREMRDRIRKKCHERLMLDHENVEHWLSLLRQLDAARVSTIHSFCGSLLRSHAIEAGLDPRFGVLDPNQASTLLNDLLDDELRRQLTIENPPLMDLVVDYGLRIGPQHGSSAAGRAAGHRLRGLAKPLAGRNGRALERVPGSPGVAGRAAARLPISRGPHAAANSAQQPDRPTRPCGLVARL